MTRWKTFVNYCVSDWRCATFNLMLQCFIVSLATHATVVQHGNETFEDFFLLFFASTQLFSTYFIALLFKADANVQHSHSTFQILKKVFRKFFFKAFSTLKTNSFCYSLMRLAFKADAKVEPTFYSYKLYWKKISRFFSIKF